MRPDTEQSSLLARIEIFLTWLIRFITYDIWRILEEEVRAYYRGERSMEATVETIQNRVGLYREENGK